MYAAHGVMPYMLPAHDAHSPATRGVHTDCSVAVVHRSITTLILDYCHIQLVMDAMLGSRDSVLQCQFITYST